ncbi:hypothetical protein LSAT2_024670 [Lamellibrachia satsuma]|nr:hypothetical protein LSAT2_024670 [Lamellibrachia satsuma]
MIAKKKLKDASGPKIIIYDDLTSLRSKLLREVKKDSRVKRVFTRDGRIHYVVYENGREKKLTLDNSDDLFKLDWSEAMIRQTHLFMDIVCPDHFHPPRVRRSSASQVKHNQHLQVWNDLMAELPQRLTQQRPFWTEAAAVLAANITEKQMCRQEWGSTYTRKRNLVLTIQMNFPYLTFLDAIRTPSTASRAMMQTQRTIGASKTPKMRMQPRPTNRCSHRQPLQHDRLQWRNIQALHIQRYSTRAHVAHAGRLDGPMNVLISGGPSPLGVHLADYLLRNGHRVSITQNHELDVSVSAEDRQLTTDLLDRLRTFNYGNRFFYLQPTTCSLKITSTQSVNITNVSHVVFDGTYLYGNTRAIVVRRSLGCLVELLETTKGGKTRPHFTLLVNADVTATGKAEFTSVLESSMEIVVSLYHSLYIVPFTSVKLFCSTDNHMSKAPREASVVVEELPSAITEAMLTRSTCKHIHVAKCSSSGLQLSWSQLWKTWNDPSAEKTSTSTNSTGEDVVFTTFLTSKMDPQRISFVKNNDYGYMAGWHVSLREVGIKAVVFHDGLGAQFM